MENIILIEDLPDFIDRAIAKVNEGVALARARGILAELPKEVQFDVTLVSVFQSQNLVIASADISTGSDNSGGSSTTVNNGTSNRTSNNQETSTGSSNGNDSSTSAGTNANYTYTD